MIYDLYCIITDVESRIQHEYGFGCFSYDIVYDFELCVPLHKFTPSHINIIR